MADDYAKIKRTPEYGRAKREVEDTINKAIDPLRAQIDKMTVAIQALEMKLQVLEGRLPKP